MRRILLGLCVLFFLNAHGQEIPLPEKMPQDHPRVLTTPEGTDGSIYATYGKSAGLVIIPFGHVLEVACNGSVRER